MRSLQSHNQRFFSSVLSDGSESQNLFSPAMQPCSPARQEGRSAGAAQWQGSSSHALHRAALHPAKNPALLNAGLCHFSGCSGEEETAVISVLLHFTHYIYCFLLCLFITNAYCALKLIFLAIHHSWNHFALLP